MEISKLKEKFLASLPFYRWHPEVAIRYLPIVDFLRRSGPGTVLEIGSGTLGIAPYLGWPVTGLDVSPSGPKYSGLHLKKGKAEAIPFANDSFDYVLAVDTFEHLPKDIREKVASEMLRIARIMVVIATPTGDKSVLQDQKLALIYFRKFHRSFSFFEEHQKFGLASVQDLEAMIKNAALKNKKKINIVSVGNENLTLREFLMHGWMTDNPLINFFHRKFLLILIPLFILYDRQPYYRIIFKVELIPNENRD